MKCDWYYNLSEDWKIDFFMKKKNANEKILIGNDK